jgi:hypothetical protein
LNETDFSTARRSFLYKLDVAAAAVGLAAVEGVGATFGDVEGLASHQGQT